MRRARAFQGPGDKVKQVSRHTRISATVLLSLFAFVIVPCPAAPLALDGETVVVLRHGENPAAGLGQLTCQGSIRALALSSVLIGRIGRPDGAYETIYVFHITHSGKADAPLVTPEVQKGRFDGYVEKQMS